jgi:hypothetical protein
MANGSKYKCPMKSMAPVRHPAARGEIERRFRTVSTHYSGTRFNRGPGEVGAAELNAPGSVEVDEYVCESIRVMREMDLFVDFEVATPPPPFLSETGKGE